MKELNFTISAVEIYDSTEILEAVKYLCNWFEQSWSIPAKYKDYDWVVNHLEELKKAVPYKPVTGQLYRIIGSDTKPKSIIKKLLFKPGLSSYTLNADMSTLKSLADSIGALDNNCCIVTRVETPVTPLFDYRWCFGAVLEYMQKNFPLEIETRKLEEMSNYEWQKEVVCFSSKKIRASIVDLFE